MGMYDRIYFTKSHTAMVPTCADGHPFIMKEIQSKCFDSEMDAYYIHLGRLYHARWHHLEDGDVDLGFEISPDGDLVRTRKKTYRAKKFTGTINCYSDCFQCDPVLYLPHDHVGELSGDRVQEARPWADWNFGFVDGALKTIVATERHEGREVLRKRLVARGTVEVLADDDRMARRHMERKKKNPGRD